MPLGYPEDRSQREAYCPETMEEKQEKLSKDPEGIAAMLVY